MLICSGVVFFVALSGNLSVILSQWFYVHKHLEAQLEGTLYLYYIPAMKYTRYNHFSDSKIQNLVSRYSGDIFPYHHPPCFFYPTHKIKASNWRRTLNLIRSLSHSNINHLNHISI